MGLQYKLERHSVECIPPPGPSGHKCCFSTSTSGCAESVDSINHHQFYCAKLSQSAPSHANNGPAPEWGQAMPVQASCWDISQL